jgi:Pvc16 N-terminal domain
VILEAATLLLAGLNGYIHADDGNPVGSADVAILGNPSQIEDAEAGPALQNQILLTVLNLEEEAALKNGQTVFVENGGVAVRHRPVHLNLLLMFSAHFANYGTALRRLGQIVTYFQAHKKFRPAGFPGVLTGIAPGTELSVTMELVTLSLEELNHVWGALGGRELPFAAYRARLVVLREDRPADGGSDIRDIPIRMRDTAAALGEGG